jgi:hypothetical protein
MADITSEQLKMLVELQAKFHAIVEKRKDYNKKGYVKWRSTVDEDKYKAMRKESNAKYNAKKKMEKLGKVVAN